MSKIRGRRTSLLLLVQGRSRGLLLRRVFRDKTMVIRAKARVNHPKMRDISRLLASQGRGHVSIATGLDIGNRIVLRGRDPRVMGHPSLSHQWDVRRLSLFLLTPPWARGTSISPRALHIPLLLHNQAKWVMVWVEVKDRDHKLGLQGLKDVSTPSHLKLSLQIIRSFKVHFYSFTYGKKCCLIQSRL